MQDDALTIADSGDEGSSSDIATGINSPKESSHHDIGFVDDFKSYCFPKLGPDLLKIELGSPRSLAKKKKLITVAVHGDETGPLVAANEILYDLFTHDSHAASTPQNTPQATRKGIANLENQNHDDFHHEISEKNPFVLQEVLEDTRVVIMVGNPRALEERKRFIDVNLNRIFTETFVSEGPKDHFFHSNYEFSLVHSICQEIADCDEYLDMHSTSSKSVPFAIPADNEESRKLAESFGAGFVIEDLIKSVKGTTIDFAQKLGKISCCVECGQHEERSTIEFAKDTIISFIRDDKAPKARNILCCHCSQTLEEGFKFVKKVTAFEKVNYGELVAVDQFKEIRCPYKNGAFIIMPTSKPVIGEEAWFWGLEVKNSELVDLRSCNCTFTTK